jgi:SAM-dependent methyltransferase
MAERAWIWRHDEGVPELRKPRPSTLYGPTSGARQKALAQVLPTIPAGWQKLAADDPDVLTLFRRESLGSPRTVHRRIPPAYLVEPFSLQWFQAAERLRYSGPGRWFSRVLEFGKHAGETLLGLGKSLGTDWVQFARCGCKVWVCSTYQDELQLVRRNFALQGLPLRSHHASWTQLPLDSASVDVVHLDGLLHEIHEPRALVNEIFRVLKPGGKVVAVVPARPRRWQAFHNPRALVVGLGSRELKRLFLPHFIEHRRFRRHIRRREAWWGYRWLPRTMLEHCFGRYWILKAFKPVNIVNRELRLAS